MRRSSRQLQCVQAGRQSLVSEQHLRLEAPSVKPLTPTQTGPNAAALVASILDYPVLITRLIKLSEDTDTLKQTLLSFPSSEWENLQTSLEKVLHCCQELYAANQDKEGQISLLAEGNAHTEDCHDGRPDIDAPDRLEESQEVEQVPLEEDASEADDESGDNLLSVEPDENHSEPEGKVEGYQPPEETQSEGTSEDEIEDSQSPDETEEDGATKTKNDIGNSQPLEEDGFPSGHAPDDTLSAGVEAQHELENDSCDPVVGLVDFDSQEPFWTKLSPLDDDIPVTARSTKSAAPHQTPQTPQESPSKYTATTLVGSSPQNLPTETRETTPAQSIISVKEDPYWRLVTQSDIDFATESFEQVKNFSVPGSSQDTIQYVWRSLRGGRGTTTYSDGSEWVRMVGATDTDRDRSSIFPALATIAFFRWHENQTRLELRHIEEEQLALAPSKKTRNLDKAASKNVTKRFPSERRGYVNKKLTRGRKWSYLVERLGFGILFRHTWAFGKAAQPSLEQFIPAFRKSNNKMFVLTQLEKQLDLFVSTGQTSINIIEQALLKRGLLKPSPQSVSQEVSDLQKLVRDSIREPMNEPSFMDRLYIKIRDLNWGFYFTNLERLKEETWFSGDLVQLCMQLADKLQYMRVGFTVSVHDRKTGSALPQPLQWAAKQVRRWKSASATDLPLVCFFPLHLRNDHFVLLEINEVDRYVYCYDTGDYGAEDVQAACRDEFPHLQFKEQRILGRSDGTSCGPCVVAIARKRMMCRSVEDLGRHDALQLRLDALHVIRNAWDSKVLIPVPSDDRDSGNDTCMLIEKSEGLGAETLDAEKNVDAENVVAEKNHPPKQRKRKRGTGGDSYAAPQTRRKARKVN
ncbi:hypothetical protein PG994_009982 [Apiospora phragmitis]|uniref:Ubiquitin-like protease family profile domain-containing protein n=1 Tax=Apiospora phragmitis TaxID=2905665 RepID=A0ABR1TNU7_9PEZI